MPVWGQVVLGIAAVTVALGVIWQKIIRPGAKVIGVGEDLRPLVTRLNDLVPLLEDMVTQFARSPHAFEILNDIIAQFRNDSGTTLRDVVDGLTVSAETTKVAADAAAVATQVANLQLEAAKQVAAQDRAQIAELAAQVARLVKLVDQLNDKVHASDMRDRDVAARLTAAQDAVDGVAVDLAQAHARAEAIKSGQHGAAADAAARMTAAEIEIVEQAPEPP